MYSAPYQPTNILRWFHAEQEQIERERGEIAGTEKTVQEDFASRHDPVEAGSVGQPGRQTTRRSATYRERLPQCSTGGLAKVGRGLIQSISQAQPPRLPPTDRRVRQRHRQTDPQ